MKILKFIKFLLPVGLLIVGAAQFAAAQTGSEAAVNSFIAKQAKREKADEYPKARKMLRGDMNGDGKTDLVVLYTLEGFGGGNSYIQYLAVFLGRGKAFVYAANSSVGGKNQRSIDLISISGGKINLGTLGYRANDASCCPSKKGKSRYTFSGGKLKEM